MVASFIVGNETGLEPLASIMSIRVCDANGECLVSEVSAGLKYIFKVTGNGAKPGIINISLHFKYVPILVKRITQVIPFQNLMLIVAQLNEIGYAILVVAADNQGENVNSHFPGNCSFIITVAAHDSQFRFATRFSNYGFLPHCQY